MTQLKANLFSNILGTGWNAFMQLLFVPLYIRFIGIEGYGLVGFYLTLQAGLQILDFGLSPSMNREMARYSAQPHLRAEARDYLRTVEVGYWAIGLVIGVVLIAAAPIIASSWLNVGGRIPLETVRQALILMGVLASLQWPMTLYQGGLLGLQRQVAVNSVLIITNTLSHGGACLVLWLIAPNILAFLSWQILVSALRVAAMTILLWRSLPLTRHAPGFSLVTLGRVWRFAAGVSGITLISLLLTQADKVILSKVLSLEMFGYYTLATVMGSSLAIVNSPVFNAFFPRFSVLVALDDEATLHQLYHVGAQLVSAVTMPLAATLALFPFELAQLWTGDAAIAHNVASIVRLLILGTALNGLMNIPYALQLAYGWTGIALRLNGLLLMFFVPALLFGTPQFGAIGAATIWAVLNAIYVVTGVPLTHSRLLRGETRRWFIEDTGLPMAATWAVVWAGRFLVEHALVALPTVVSLALVLLAAWLAAIGTTSRLSPMILAQLRQTWLRLSLLRQQG